MIVSQDVVVDKNEGGGDFFVGYGVILPANFKRFSGLQYVGFKMYQTKFHNNCCFLIFLFHCTVYV